jgi:hypothetical protein
MQQESNYIKRYVTPCVRLYTIYTYSMYVHLMLFLKGWFPRKNHADVRIRVSGFHLSRMFLGIISVFLIF